MQQISMPPGDWPIQSAILYIADAENDVIRKVDTFGIITTVVGNKYLCFRQMKDML